MHGAEVQGSKKAQGKEHLHHPQLPAEVGGEGMCQQHPSGFGSSLLGRWGRRHPSAGSSALPKKGPTEK